MSGMTATIITCSLLATSQAKTPAVTGEEAVPEQGNADLPRPAPGLRAEEGIQARSHGAYAGETAASVNPRDTIGAAPGAPQHIECLGEVEQVRFDDFKCKGMHRGNAALIVYKQ